MRAISDDFRQAINRNATLVPKATLKLASGTTRELTGDDIVDLETESSTSSESSFDIGACVVGKCSITLNNHDGRFDSYDFTGATVTPYVGKTFDAIRDDGFTKLSPSTDWELEPASDEMVVSGAGHTTASSGDINYWCHIGSYTPLDNDRILVRLRYTFSSDVDDKRLLDACKEPTLGTSGSSKVTPVSVTRVSAETYAAVLSGDSDPTPRTALVCYEIVPQPGRELSNLYVSIHGGYGTLSVDISCVPMVRTEWVRLGVYNVDQPDSYSGIISLDCLDNMSKLSRPYSHVKSAFPSKPEELIEDIFRECSMTVTWNSQPAYTQQVTRCPDSDSLTCLQAATYLCQMMGLWCRADEWGNAYLSWYDSAAFEQESWLDGGSYENSSSPYSDGSRADGGNFTNYSSGAAYNGGTLDTNRQVGHVLAPFSSTVMTDDVVVTGISVTASNEVKVGDDGKETNGADGETALSGRSGYVLEVKSNPFVEYGKASAVSNALNSRIGGMRFRPLSATAPSDPSIEAGDSLVVGDRKGNYYCAFATTVSLKVCDSMTVKCSAKSAARNSAATASAATQAIVQARNELKREMTSRELAEQEMNEKLANASGLYSTVETLSDGSKVYFFHDKPTVSASKVIWKVTAQAMAVSTDGGKTYATGLTADGNAILNRIYAIGIDANYITTGMIRSKPTKTDTSLASYSSSQTNGWSGVSDGEMTSSYMSHSVSVDGPTTITVVFRQTGGTGGLLYAYAADSSRNFFSSTGSILDGSPNTLSIDIPDGRHINRAGIMWQGGSQRPIIISIDVYATNMQSSSSWDLVNGQFKSKDVDITGTIHASGGSIAGFKITPTEISNDVVSLRNSGMHLYRNGADVGNIGTNNVIGLPTVRGLDFDLNPDGNYMTMAYQSSGSDLYNMKWTYSRSSIRFPNSNSGYDADTMNAGCDVNMHYNAIKGAKIDLDNCYPVSGGERTGISGTINFVKINSLDSSGHYNYTSGCYMTFKNGVLTDAKF